MKWFMFPFALSGTRTAVPDDTQPSGAVSYEEGYGVDYSRDPVSDPLAKRIERNFYNQILYDITSWIRELTQLGTPIWVSSAQNGGTPLAYDRGAVVLVELESGWGRYESLVNNNTYEPSTDDTKWLEVNLYNRLTERTSPAFTGTPTAPTAAPGTNSTQVATCAFVALGSGPGYVHAFQYDGADTYTMAHGLDGTPTLINLQAKVRPGQTDLDYPAGRAIQLGSSANTYSGDHGVTLSCDDTNIYLTIAADGIQIVDNNATPHTGDMDATGKWDFIVSATYFVPD